MSTELTHGIANRGEFYSHHYLDALLAGDLKPLLARWAEAEKGTPPVRPPPKVLNGLAGNYFQARAEAAEVGEHAPEVSWRVAHDLHVRLLEALGYERAAAAVTLADGTTVPLLHEVRRGGSSYLWVLEAAFPGEEDADPMDARPLRGQLPAGGTWEDAVLPALSWREILDGPIFREDDAPTWVLFLGGSELVLTHAYKWSKGQAIAFDLDALYARRQAKAFRAMAGLLHADALCPAQGVSLHETLDENSHKHAFAVSTDLREGAQQAIELLGNEAVWYLRKVRGRGVFGSSETAEKVDASELTRECLTWLYRLIFLFYVEARSEELGVAPMKSTAYRRGYSLESLRALETVPLTTPQAQEGNYIDASLRKLFVLLNDGHPKDAQMALLAGVDTVAFRIHGLKSRLFDDADTPILNKVRFRNAVLQKVIELLSLSREGKSKTRGRISYASLGINQLGAVYEGLLSYSGFFAQENLIEVVNAKENGNADARTFFVPARDRELYEEAELVRDEHGARKQYDRGTYLFRLAGRDREKSASYYTPEVLTRCLVKYTLRERIGTDRDDPNWVEADGLLDLTLCEPAMGSGAFLNEVVNQLAEAYLVRKQDELRRDDPEHPGIPADRYLRELQRVKARIAANQCYGVDLNPLAAELGKVSLWLNVLRAGAPAPFFDARIMTGNSLVGARRATYSSARLHKTSKKTGDGWLDLAPSPLSGPRARGSVYHFLLPAKGMAAFDKDKVVKGLLPDDVDRIKDWRKKLNAAWSEAEKARLEELSVAVDRLWAEHAAHRDAALAECDQRHPVWPEPEPPPRSRQDEEHLRRSWATQERTNSAGKRLKRAMDYWSAMWFWPVRESGLLPSRSEWLDDLAQILVERPRGDLERAEDAQALRLRLVPTIAAKRRFFHWEWAFPEVFARGGFDVVVGNPPWLRVEFKESGVLSDLDPRLAIRRQTAKEVADLRSEVLGDEEALDIYLGEFEEMTGVREFSGNDVLNPLLAGTKANLYKTFLGRAWDWLAKNGAGGMFHQAGVFDDPKGGRFRRALYPRLRFAALAKNQLKLFDGVHHERPYCFTIWTGGPAPEPVFRYISNLFHPRTLDESLVHDGSGEVPGIKDAEGTWDLRGHASRIVDVDEETLGLFASLYDPPGTPALEARLPVVHSGEISSVLRGIGRAESVRDDGRWQTYPEWNEGTRTADDTIARMPGSDVEEPTDLVFSGPHFYVATPFNKSPNPGCAHNQDYSVVDLGRIGADYLPRTVFAPGLPVDSYRSRMPSWNGRRLFDHPRYSHRTMVAPTGERTLVPAILPPGPAALETVFTVAFREPAELVQLAGFNASLPADFFVKTTGASKVRRDVFSSLPFPTAARNLAIANRALRLNCLTNHYADLWSELYTPDFAADTHTKPDARLPDWTHLGPEWTWDTPLRTPFARRQALVELDALAALALGLTDDELCLIYRIQFPVLQQYEADTWYDRRGRIVFTNNRGLHGVGLARKEWDAIKGEQLDPQTFAGVAPLPDDARDALGPYEPPFDRCDRETDMRQAYCEFVRRGVVRETP